MFGAALEETLETQRAQLCFAPMSPPMNSTVLLHFLDKTL